MRRKSTKIGQIYSTSACTAVTAAVLACATAAFAGATDLGSKKTANAGGVLQPKMAPTSVTTSPNSCAVQAQHLQPGQRLQGGTAMVQVRDPYLEAWRASMLYQQGAWALQMNDVNGASMCFKASGDAFEASIGEGRFLAESRFAEAQTRKLMGQIPQSARLFQISVDIFRRTDPYNPYLIAGIQNLRLMGYVDQQIKPPPPKPKKPAPAKLKLQELQPRVASIDRQLKGGVAKLEDGTLIASLHDKDFFDGSKKLLPQVAGCDLSDQFLKGAVYNAFHEMTCLEFAALSANYLNAHENYKPFLVDGKPVVVGASEDIWESPNAKININGKEYAVSMTLPGINKYSHNVALLTDGHNVLAIDPRKNDIWKLVPVLAKKGASEFNWWKLTHTKKKYNFVTTATKPKT